MQSHSARLDGAVASHQVSYGRKEHVMSVRNTQELSQEGVLVHLLSAGPGTGPDPDVRPTNDRLVHFDTSILSSTPNRDRREKPSAA